MIKYHRTTIGIRKNYAQRGEFTAMIQNPSLTLTLLFLLITHHSAPHKKVTVVKYGHTLTHDLMNWRSRALTAPDAAQSDEVGGGKERSCGVGVVSGELRGDDKNKGVGVTRLARTSLLTVVKGTAAREVETGRQFSVCKFENLGIIDSICRYRDYQSKLLNNGDVPGITTECVPRRLQPS